MKKKLSSHDQNEGENIHYWGPILINFWEGLYKQKKHWVYNLKWFYTKHTTVWLMKTACLLGNDSSSIIIT